MKKQLLKTLLAMKMATTRLSLWQPLVRKTLDPRQCQEALLRKILKDNRNTRFGREHGFHEIRSYEDYRRQVPVGDYEALRPYIEAQEADRKTHLNPQLPVMYAVNSAYVDGGQPLQHGDEVAFIPPLGGG